MNRQEATNTFQEGMVMDFNPLTTPDNVVTNCLNGTLITFNGNEYVLQNDMGNGRVETAYLPEGYVPLGTAELGGIVYIVSYNPFNNKCQIGSFPSPERNITSDELFGEENPVTISDEDFIEKCENEECNDTDRCISAPIIKKQLGDWVLHPGDKFLVCGNSIKDNITRISHYKDGEEIKGYITFRFATIDNSGRIIYLDDLKKYQIQNDKDVFDSNIKEGTAKSSTSPNVDDYRRIVGSDYNIFSSKIAGNLYIIGQLEVVDYIESVTWNVLNIEDYKPETKPDTNVSEEGADTNTSDTNTSDTINSEDENPETKPNTNESNTNTVIVSTEGDRKRYSIQFNVQSVSERGNKLSGIKQYHSSETEPIKIANEGKDLITYKINYIAKETDSVIAEIIPQMPFGSLCYLKQKITLNFSDLGSNQVKNNIWQYLKLSESINLKFDINNGYVNKNITDVVLKFTELPIDENSKSYNYNLPSRKSYSGLYAVSIPFKEGIVKPNSLYKVEIEVKLDDTYETVASHYLYTNGVYNDYFNLSDKKYENFDEVFLPLTPKVKFENSTIDLTSQNDLIEGCFFSSHKKNTDYIQGKTTYSAKDSKKINILSSLEKSFDNTFSIEGEVTKMGLAKKPDITVESQIFTLEEGNVVDSNFIKKETELNTSDKEKVVINIKDKGLQGYELNYDIFLVSKISAEITPRNVAVQKYYAPLLYYEEDFQKYCLQATFTDNTIDEITLESTLPALGMSAGGNDNQGTGGLTFVAGTANVSINTNVGPTSGEEVGLLINGFPDSVFSGAGLSGISRFPNNDMSRIIQDSKGYCGMVPVYLVNAGTSRIKYKNTVYKFQDSNDRDKEKSKKVEWFETENQNCGEFTSALLFLKIKDTDNYVPIDHFFKLGYSDRTEEKAGIKRYYSLLSQIYAQRPFENKVEVYTVGNFSYVNKKVQYKRKLEATITYNDNSLKYNNKLMVEFFGKELPNCARIDYQSNGGQIIIKSSLDYTFNIDNKYVDEYLSYYNSESIPTYVAGNGTDSINAPINPTANALYYVSDKKYLEQITSSSPISLSIVDLELSSSQDYSTISVKVTSHSFGFSNLDMLIYDIRNDYACANNSKINYLLTLYWGCHEPNYRNPTQICDKSLDTNCSITKLKIEQ